MRTKKIVTTSLRGEMEKEAMTWLGSCADDAFIAGAEWMYEQMKKEGEQKGMPRQKTAYINGQGVETR